METYSQRIKQHLDDILADLACRPDIERAQDRMSGLFAEIGVEELRAWEEAFRRAGEVLDSYQDAIERVQAKLSEDLFILVAQLEYPSRP